MPSAQQQAIAATKVANVPAVAAACDFTGLPFAAGLALMQMESGGLNVFGGDLGPRPNVYAHGPGQTPYTVTETRFEQMWAAVKAGATSNGVGPCQITYAPYFQQMADQGLDPWDPTDNCVFGFRIMAANRAKFGSWSSAGAHYNGGTNPNASALRYGQTFSNLVDEWTKELTGVPVTKIDPPSPPFIPARWHGGAQTPTKRIVIHGTVSPCEPGGARNIAHFFATESNPTSAHYVVDPGEVIQCVGDHTVAYAAPPNQDTLHVEQCDPVTGPATRWTGKNHTAMLERTAKLVARLGLAYGIPLVRLTVPDLLAGKRGICGHVDVSNAWHQTTHTDPGSGFPWDHFMGLVHDAADALLGHKPPPPPPPVPVVHATTHLEFVNAAVLPHETSDHNPVLWDFLLDSGEKFSTGTANVRGTNPDVETEEMIRRLLPQAGLWVFNECESTALQNFIHQLKGYGSYLPGVSLSEDGTTVTQGSALSWNAIVWDERYWEAVDDLHEHSQITCTGVAHVTPIRCVNRKALRRIKTGEIIWRQATHAVHHIEEGGKARVHDQIAGQNDRAKKHFYELAKDTVYASQVTFVEGDQEKTAPVIGSGDLNVDYNADRSKVLAGSGTEWFPYSMLDPVASIKNMNRHPATHAGGRLIDWGWYRQAH